MSQHFFCFSLETVKQHGCALRRSNVEEKIYFFAINVDRTTKWSVQMKIFIHFSGQRWKYLYIFQASLHLHFRSPLNTPVYFLGSPLSIPVCFLGFPPTMLSWVPTWICFSGSPPTHPNMFSLGPTTHPNMLSLGPTHPYASEGGMGPHPNMLPWVHTLVSFLGSPPTH